MPGGGVVSLKLVREQTVGAVDLQSVLSSVQLNLQVSIQHDIGSIHAFLTVDSLGRCEIKARLVRQNHIPASCLRNQSLLLFRIL